MQDHDDFAFEPIPGLPEHLPDGETMLWQGRPKVLPLARQSLWLNWVMGYFAVLVVWRVLASAADHSFLTALGHGVPLALVGSACVGVIVLVAWLQARGTVYTLTSHRVVMRIGAALQLSLNLPYQWIDNANLDLRRDGTGTIALELRGETKISYLMAWPHVRPWRMAQPEPALRCIPDAAKVAQILATAAETRVSEPSSIKVTPVAAKGGVTVPAE